MNKIVLFISFMFVFIFVQNRVFSQEQDIYFIAYMNRIQNKVKSNWILPHGELDKKTVIVFKINREGKILNADIAEKSGDAEFDQNALDAVYKSVPFENIPSNIKDDAIIIGFAFSQSELEAKPISEVTNTNVVSQITYVNNPTPLLLSNASISEVKSKTRVKKVSHKTSKSTHGYNGKVTPKTAGAGVLSLVIWPGLGQLVNNGPSEKAGIHAILGVITVFRFWSFYDALVNRQEGPI